MHGRPNRTDCFAGRLLAMHAQHRLKVAIGRSGASLVLAVDAQPVHLSLVNHLLFADNGNIVLGLAGDNASIATNAGVQVDTDRPGGGSFGLPTIQVRLRLVGGERPRVLAILGKCCVPDIFSRLVEDQIVVVVQAKFMWPGTFCSDGALARPLSG